MQADKRIRTVLYGDQKLTAAELEVLHTPSMQRLYGLKQLGLADRVFIDASHSRIHHVVGVLEHVNKLVDAIVKNLKLHNRKLRIGAKNKGCEILETNDLVSLVEDRREVVRFIGLLHDLTHAPYGHTVEDEIGIVKSKHDDPGRQADAFYRLICQLVAWLSLEAFGPSWDQFPESLRPFLTQSGEAQKANPIEVGRALRVLISSSTDGPQAQQTKLGPQRVAEMFAQLQCAMTALLHLEALHKPEPENEDFPRTSYEFQEAVQEAFKGSKFEHLIEELKFEPRRDAFMLDIVGNTVCADLLDYARRDSHYAGLRLDCDPDRIAENFTLVSVDALAYEINHPDESGGKVRASRRDPDSTLNPFKGWCLRTAISMVSHKYRTDVPSELMNLLNVRYYLYERVIFHPTKCAAGSMLGTALQLLGWRKSESGESTEIPERLRFVGDEVFLHDLSVALDLVLAAISALPDGAQIDRQLIKDNPGYAYVHSGLVNELLSLRLDQEAATAQVELRAARLLLSRLMSRRYFRPIFRALPSSVDVRLQAGPEALSDLFRDPDVRFRAEREIEAKADLPVGTITIHCPARTTARKVANVFLTKPDPTGDGTSDPVFKLKDIECLDKEIFGDHQKAVKAVEKMYGSMWRLNVYIAPEHIAKWLPVSKIAGCVIFEAVDAHQHFKDEIGDGWPNDPSLVSELRIKIPLHGEGGDALAPDSPAYKVAQFTAGHVGGAAASSDGNVTPRVDRVFTVIRGYVQINKKSAEQFRKEYGGRLNRRTESEFDEVLTMAQSAVTESSLFDEKTPARKGHDFQEFKELLDDILRQFENRSPEFPGEPEE